MSQHLGDRIAAFVDGELSHEARDRTLAHLTHCARCRADVDAAREVKRYLAGSAQPTPSAGFLAALIDLAEPGPPLPPPPHRPLPGSARPRGSVAPAPGRPRTAPSGRPPRAQGSRHRLRYAAMGAPSLAAVTLTTSFAVGGGVAQNGAPVSPALNRYGVEHANTANLVPLTDPALDAYPAIDPAPAAPVRAAAAHGASPSPAPTATPPVATTFAPSLAGLHGR